MVFIKFESELKQLQKEINKKHKAIKFDIKSSKKTIEFLDTLVYIDNNNPLLRTNWLSKLLTC